MFGGLVVSTLNGILAAVMILIKSIEPLVTKFPEPSKNPERRRQFFFKTGCCKRSEEFMRLVFRAPGTQGTKGETLKGTLGVIEGLYETI